MSEELMNEIVALASKYLVVSSVITGVIFLVVIVAFFFIVHKIMRRK